MRADPTVVLSPQSSRGSRPRRASPSCSRPSRSTSTRSATPCATAPAAACSSSTSESRSLLGAGALWKWKPDEAKDLPRQVRQGYDHDGRRRPARRDDCPPAQARNRVPQDRRHDTLPVRPSLRRAPAPVDPDAPPNPRSELFTNQLLANDLPISFASMVRVAQPCRQRRARVLTNAWPFHSSLAGGRHQRRPRRRAEAGQPDHVPLPVSPPFVERPARAVLHAPPPLCVPDRLAPSLSLESHAAACARSQGIAPEIIERSAEVACVRLPLARPALLDLIRARPHCLAEPTSRGSSSCPSRTASCPTTRSSQSLSSPRPSLLAPALTHRSTLCARAGS